MPEAQDQKPPHVLCIGHADSPQFSPRCSVLMQAGFRITELTGQMNAITPGAQCAVTLGLPLGRFWRLITLSRMLSFFSLVRHIAPDIIFIQYAQGLWAWLAPLTGLPVVVNIMGGDVLFDEQGQPSHAEQKATRNLLNASDLVLCKTPYLFRRVSGLGTGDRARICSWGVDRTIFHPEAGVGVRKRLRVAQKTLLIFSPRAMQPLYNIETIIQAFAVLAAQGRDVLLMLSTYRADAKYELSLRNLCHWLNLEDKIIFLPALCASEMAAHLAAADIAVSIPSSDGFPQTFLEAAACRTPMLMSILPNYSDCIQHGCHTYLTVPTPDALAEGLTRLADDKALRRTLADGAMRLLEGINSSEVILWMKSLLRRPLLQSGKRFIFRALMQIPLIFIMLAYGRPIAARQGQPVANAWTDWLRKKFNKT